MIKMKRLFAIDFIKSGRIDSKVKYKKSRFPIIIYRKVKVQINKNAKILQKNGTVEFGKS